MSNIDKLAETLFHQQKQLAHTLVQVRWAVCKEVDWAEGTMTAIGQSDELEYLNVLLGAGSILLKPVVGALCLLAVIEGEDTATFLLSASEIEEVKVLSTKGNIDISNGKTSLYNVFESLVKLITNIKVVIPDGVSLGLDPITSTNLKSFEILFKQLLK